MDLIVQYRSDMVCGRLVWQAAEPIPSVIAADVRLLYAPLKLGDQIYLVLNVKGDLRPEWKLGWMKYM